MAKEFIVAIELGSSKIAGVAGKKNIDGSISVLASVREEASSFIRRGVVYNIDKTAQCISNIVKKLSGTLKTEIARVYVGVGGQSIHSVKNTIIKELPADTIVTQEMVDELIDTNRNMTYPDQELIYAATQEYKIDGQEETDPVGIQCRTLEGNFLNILWRKTFYRNLNKCFEQAGVAIAEMYLAPLVLADSVLTDTEKRSGCVLVDLGADTTTVSVYYKNIMRHLVVIPLGGNNITKDIASLRMEEADAEKIKIEYGSAYTDNNDIDSSLKITIDEDRSIDSRSFTEIVEGRMQEIVENVRYQITGRLSDRLLGGIILTGGGSNMKAIETSFRKYMGIDKIRIAKTVTHTISSRDPFIMAHNGMMCTVLGLLARGDMNCAGQQVNTSAGLFDTDKPTAAETGKEPRKASELGQGIVQTEAEKQKIEERRRREEEEKKAEEERQKAKEEEEKKNKNGIGQLGKKINKWIKGMLTEE